MRRREFITGLGGAAAWPLVALGQQPAMPVLGFVSFGQREGALQSSWYQAFHERLRDLGWVPGRNLSIEYRFADNKRERLLPLARDLVDLKPNAIFVPTRPALPALKEATTTIPIVFVSLGDPVAEGWVASLRQTGRQSHWRRRFIAGTCRKAPRITARTAAFAVQSCRAVEPSEYF